MRRLPSGWGRSSRPNRPRGGRATPSARQRICKPGSVQGRSLWTAIPLGLALPTASSNQPGRLGRFLPCPGVDCSIAGTRRPYAVLLPVGFTLPLGLPSARWALTPPFQPCLCSEKPSAVCSLWHCPWGHPRRGLPGTVVAWSPDFPPPLARRRPSNPLARAARLRRTGDACQARRVGPSGAMRFTPLLLLAALAGCSTIRQGLGEYQKAADKGLQVGSSAAAEPLPGAPAAAEVDRGKAVLPGGLGGDKANAAYTSPPQ